MHPAWRVTKNFGLLLRTCHLKHGELMAIRAKAVIRLKFASEKQLTTLLNALEPETKVLATRRANVKLEKDNLYLLLMVDAEDTVALRATLNAFLRWINSTINVIAIVEQATLK